ncbi:hypothetical protein BK816_08005 [Boudabousia tangfeifanii]|uniref:Beta-galactosidase n=2 Tax=Boudabousia tangfeifanii TaxID=1912795 RepID=A0A1D9MN24_9ACTO|nr:hypothetical protein BK816_08005 [Boudabousia tangfeifanii]
MDGEVAYGGDYNPEQWDAETVAEDLRLMAQAKVNLVTPAVFAWTNLEPEEGQYDFDWLEEVLDKLHQTGVKVDLATGTASPPAWMAQKYPETLPVNEHGVRLGFGSRQQYCPNSPKFKERARALAKAMAERFASHPAVRMWHISNEYGCHISACYCDNCLTAFRGWLQDKYGQIDALNQAWGTNFWSQAYRSFDQVGLPASLPTFHNPGQMLDWRRFCDFSLRQLMLAEAEELRAVTPRLPLTTNFMALFPALDYWEWAKHLDIISDDSYPEPASRASAAQVAFEGDLMRSLGRGRFLLMEQAPAGVQWRLVNSPKRPGVHPLWSLSRIAHGADGICQFQWRQSLGGAETFHSGMVPHAGENSRIFKETVHLGEMLAKLAPALTDTCETKVAIVLDWESEWARLSAIGPRQYVFGDSIRAWHRTFFEAGYQVDFVPADVAHDLSGYQLLVLPQLFAVSDQYAAHLKQLAEAGLHILVASPSGTVNEHLQASLGSAAGPLTDLTGVRVVEHWTGSEALLRDRLYADPHPLVDRITSVINAPGETETVDLDVEVGSPLARALEQFGKPAPALRGTVWAELAELASGVDEADVQVLATYLPSGVASDLAGQFAITSRKLGEGVVTYLGVDLDPVGRAALGKYLCAKARLQPTWADAPAGVEAVRRGSYLFLLNHTDQAKELAGINGQELLSDAEVTGHLVLAPRSVAVVAQN